MSFPRPHIPYVIHPEMPDDLACLGCSDPWSGEWVPAGGCGASHEALREETILRNRGNPGDAEALTSAVERRDRRGAYVVAHPHDFGGPLPPPTRTPTVLLGDDVFERMAVPLVRHYVGRGRMFGYSSPGPESFAGAVGMIASVFDLDPDRFTPEHVLTVFEVAFPSRGWLTTEVQRERWGVPKAADWLRRQVVLMQRGQS